MWSGISSVFALISHLQCHFPLRMSFPHCSSNMPPVFAVPLDPETQLTLYSLSLSGSSSSGLGVGLEVSLQDCGEACSWYDLAWLVFTSEASVICNFSQAVCSSLGPPASFSSVWMEESFNGAKGRRSFGGRCMSGWRGHKLFGVAVSKNNLSK